MYKYLQPLLKTMPKFSLAFTTYKRFAYLDRILELYTKTPEVDEIVINDDCSEDYKLLIAKYGTISKIKIFQNSKNLGAALNKIHTVKLCTNDYVLLMDSDNTIGVEELKYLHSLDVKDNHVICPGQAIPAFNYSALEHQIDHTIFNKSDLHRCFANTGNYLVPKKLYLSAANLVEESKVDPGPYDVIYINYFICQLGGKLINDKQLKYQHRASSDGLWVTTHSKYDSWFNTFLNVLNQHTKVDTHNKFKPSCAMVYPPFKSGLYLEESFSKFYSQNKNKFPKDWVYIDILWTNIYCNNLFQGIPYQSQELQEFINTFPKDKKYFTVVQFDDGVLQKLPEKTLVFAAGGVGHVPLPLIYEDHKNTLSSQKKLDFKDKSILCSFIGGMTYKLRNVMWDKLKDNQKFAMCKSGTPQDFIDITRKSKFCLAPRGYGRSSFRFFEAFQLGTIPVYLYDDIKWLPYQHFVDYSKICVVIKDSELDTLEAKLSAIDEKAYNIMFDEYHKVSQLFTLNGMNEYILSSLLEYNKIDNIRSECSWVSLYHGLVSNLINERKYTKCVEIGVAYGFHADNIIANTTAEYTGIDPYIASYDANDIFCQDLSRRLSLNPEQAINILHNYVCNKFAMYSGRAKLLRGFSDDKLKEFKDQSIDLLFIDGNHTYEYVLKDLRQGWSKVRSGGCLCGDDYTLKSVESAVKFFAQEIKQQYQLLYKKGQDYPIFAFFKDNKTPLTMSTEGLPSYSLPDNMKQPIDHKLIKVFNFKQGGVFIEAGANDGVSQSNTKLLEDRFGWTGLLIEPSPVSFDKVKVNRPKCINFNSALVSFDYKGDTISGDFNGHLMSSVDGKRLNKNADITIKARTLTAICEESKIFNIDLFSLDVEGYEYDVLNGIDFSKINIKYFLIEVYNKDYQKIVDFLDTKGYSLLYNISNYNKKDNPIWDGTHNDYLFMKN